MDPRTAPTLDHVAKMATANRGRLHATVTCRIQGMPDYTFHLSHPNGLDNADDLQHALQVGADALGDPDSRVAVPMHAETIAKRLEVIRARLSHLARRTLSEAALADLEREGDALSSALGAALARAYLEQRRERD